AIVENYEILILDMTTVPRLGVTALLAIETMIKDAMAKRRDVFLVGAQGQVRHRLQRLEIVQKLPPHHQVDERIVALERSMDLIHDYAPVA
ncbi:MAG: STAS domain-containing protein, partial [Cyanobacteria bacterium P01_D01_bin.56]